MAKNHPEEPSQRPVGLTDEEIAREEKFMEGLPFFNYGALFMPAIWGPGHGQIITVLFYPLWIFCDNVFYAAYATPTPLSVAVALIVFVVMTLFTLAYGRLSQPRAWHRAYERGMTKEQYLAVERKWAIAMGIVAVVLIAAATWYNLVVKTGM